MLGNADDALRLVSLAEAVIHVVIAPAPMIVYSTWQPTRAHHSFELGGIMQASGGQTA